MRFHFFLLILLAALMGCAVPSQTIEQPSTSSNAASSKVTPEPAQTTTGKTSTSPEVVDVAKNLELSNPTPKTQVLLSIERKGNLEWPLNPFEVIDTKSSTSQVLPLSDMVRKWDGSHSALFLFELPPGHYKFADYRYSQDQYRRVPVYKTFEVIEGRVNYLGQLQIETRGDEADRAHYRFNFSDSWEADWKLAQSRFPELKEVPVQSTRKDIRISLKMGEDYKKAVQDVAFISDLKPNIAIFSNRLETLLMGHSRNQEGNQATNDRLKVSEKWDRFAAYQASLQVLSDNLDPLTLKELEYWHFSPLGRAIAKAKKQMSLISNSRVQSKLKNYYEDEPPTYSREYLLSEYLSLVGMGETIKGLGKNLARTVVKKQMESMGSETNPSIDAFIEDSYEKRMADKEFKIKEQLLREFHYAFRDLSDNELGHYVNFLKSAAARRMKSHVTKSLLKQSEDYLLTGSLDSAEILAKGKDAETGIVHFDAARNFAFSAPDASWVKLGKDANRPAIALQVLHRKPDVQFMIIAEVLGANQVKLSSQRLAQVAQANMKSVVSKMDVVEEKPLSIAGIDGIVFPIKASAAGQKVYYKMWVSSYNGFAYQLVIFGSERNEVAVNEQFDELVKGFEILDMEKVALSKGATRFKTFTSPQFGYTLDLNQSTWVHWENANDEIPAAETGGCWQENCFVVVPFYFGDENPSKEALAMALSANLEIEGDMLRNVEKQNSHGMETWKTRLHDRRDNQEYTFDLKFLFGKKSAYFVAVWGPEHTMGDDEAQFFDNLTFDESLLNEDHLTDSSVSQLQQAYLYNQIGLHYHGANSFQSALGYFNLASQFGPKVVNYLTNSLDMYNRMHEYQAGLDHLKQYQAHHSDSLLLKSWKAWFLSNSEKDQEALAAYQELFDLGYQDESDFIAFMNLLEKEENWDKAEMELEKYRKSNDSLVLQVTAANLERSKGEPEKSLALLKTLKAENPFSMDIEYGLARTFLALGEFKEVIKLVDEWIRSGYALGDAYYYKGKAEYELRWYQQAKMSFELALKHNPNDDASKSYLQHISSELGEGENSVVKTPIEPLPLPASLSQSVSNIDIAEMDDTDAYYAYRINGLSYDKNKIFKKTFYRKLTVLTASGVSRFSTLSFEFSPLHEDIFVNRLHVFDADGKLVAEGRVSDYYVTDKKGELLTSEQLLNVPVPQLKEGSTIEYEYTVKGKSPWSKFAYQRVLMSASKPVMLSALFYYGDTEQIVHKNNANLSPQSIDGGLYWQIKNPPVGFPEQEQPRLGEFLPIVWMSAKGQSWSHLSLNYLEDLKPHLDLNDEAVVLANQLLENIEGEREKVLALSDYVQQNYSYKGIEFGTRGVIPNTFGDIVRHQYGDCKDHTVMLYQLLKAADIESYPALVHSGNAIAEDLPTLNQFDHMVLYLPTEEGGYFVDTTNKNQNIQSTIPDGLESQRALILDGQNVRFETIPAYLADDIGMEAQKTVKLMENNMLQIQEKIAFRGLAGASARNYFKAIEPSAHSEWFRLVLSQNASLDQFKNFKISNLNDNSKDLLIEMDYRLENQCGTNQDLVTCKVPELWVNDFVSRRQLTDRKTPFENKTSYFFDSKIDFIQPDAMTGGKHGFSEQTTKGSFGRWTMNTTDSSDAYKVSHFLLLTIGKYQADDYLDYRKFLQKSADALDREFVWQKK